MKDAKEQGLVYFGGQFHDKSDMENIQDTELDAAVPSDYILNAFTNPDCSAIVRSFLFFLLSNLF